MTRRVTDQSRCSGHCVREVAWGVVGTRELWIAHRQRALLAPGTLLATIARAPATPPPRLINPQCHKRPPPPPRALRRLHHVWFKIIPTIEFRYRLVLKLPNQLAKYLTIEEDLCAAICTMGNNFGMVERNIPRPCSVEFCTN